MPSMVAGQQHVTINLTCPERPARDGIALKSSAIRFILKAQRASYSSCCVRASDGEATVAILSGERLRHSRALLQ